MTKKQHCPECDNDYTITHRSSDTPEYCPFCGERLPCDDDRGSWSDDEDEELDDNEF